MSESALARAVRDRIRAHASYLDRQCNVEIDERAPATAHDIYIIVTFGGVTPGPTHDFSGGVIDKLYSINVGIALRSPKKPRDMQRDMWIDTSASFEVHARNIEGQIDFNYPTNDAANAYILTEESSSEGFIEPLKFAGLGPIREAPAEIYAGVPGGTPAALIRTITFAGARRIVTRS